MTDKKQAKEKRTNPFRKASKKRLNAKKLFQKGIVFAFEATIAILLFTMILLTLPQNKPVTLKELAIAQQANDLLRVWSYSFESPGEMILDANTIFGEKFELNINGIKIDDKLAGKSKTTGKNTYSTEGVILDTALTENIVKITIHYD
ncbi:MAG: hypothetical protein NTY48_03630 [Candidatus Diapherotrites archaeon]|nr:hypothetical protein [Candidatus Diapherotrites archaeon]